VVIFFNWSVGSVRRSSWTSVRVCPEFVGVDGFSQVVVHAGFEAALPVLGEGARGHGDDGNVVIGQLPAGEVLG
jgi:hypothetical protein